MRDWIIESFLSGVKVSRKEVIYRATEETINEVLRIRRKTGGDYRCRLAHEHDRLTNSRLIFLDPACRTWTIECCFDGSCTRRLYRDISLKEALEVAYDRTRRVGSLGYDLVLCCPATKEEIKEDDAEREELEQQERDKQARKRKSEYGLRAGVGLTFLLIAFLIRDRYLLIAGFLTLIALLNGAELLWMLLQWVFHQIGFFLGRGVDGGRRRR